MKTLLQISNGYNTDKGEVYHNYIPYYEKHFAAYRKNSKNFLEIGLDKGESTKMWREYFSVNNTVIHGMDIVLPENLSLVNTKMYLCDQSSRQDLMKFLSDTDIEFDIIIDDGGHMQHQQQISLGVLFPKLKSGGLYVIEDLHTAGHPAYCHAGDRNTTDLIKEFIENKNFDSKYITDEERLYLTYNVSSVFLEMANVSEIAFLYKK
jgi:demethylmacrocin O-methyltransferase